MPSWPRNGRRSPRRARHRLTPRNGKASRTKSNCSSAEVHPRHERAGSRLLRRALLLSQFVDQSLRRQVAADHRAVGGHDAWRPLQTDRLAELVLALDRRGATGFGIQRLAELGAREGGLAVRRTPHLLGLAPGLGIGARAREEDV